MSPETLSPTVEKLIEEFAVRMEVFGMPRLAGKLIAAFLFADPPEKSTQDLIRITGGSKGAISQMLHLLESSGPIEKCASKNRRGHSYRLRPHFLMPLLEQKINGIRAIREFLSTHQEDFLQLSEHSRENIREIIDFHMFFQQVVQEAFDAWKRQRNHRRDMEENHKE